MAGKYINVFIRKAELQGKIGDVELEANEQLPQTWSAMKDTLMSLAEMQIPQLVEAMADPENFPFIKAAVGLDQFVIPGEADRLKQYEEIDLLVQSSPLPEEVPGEIIPPPVDEAGLPIGPPMEGPPQMIEVPSVEIDPDVDNNQIQADICRTWLISEAGQLCKKENPPGYKNVLLHMQMHVQVVNEEMMQQQLAAQPPAVGGGQGPEVTAPQGAPNVPAS